MITKICKECNKEFNIKTTTSQKFCSIECHNTHQHKTKKNHPKTNLRKYSYTEVHCKYCNTLFNSINQRKYCCDACKKNYTIECKRNSSSIKNFNCLCVVCNKQFIHNHLIKYCSDECKQIYKLNKSKYSQKTTRCKFCDNIFINKSQNNNQQFCSKKCYWDFRNNNKDIIIQKNQKDNKIKKSCVHCNKEFYVFKYRELSAQYCSKKCHYDSNRTQTICKTCGCNIATPNHLNVQYCSLDCASKGNKKRKTKLSKFVGNILNKHFACITEEYLIRSDTRSIWCDYMLNNHIVIECNGDYWHCNPNFYTPTYYHTKIKKTAQEIWDYDETRKKFIESNGYIAIFIWEDEIKQHNFEEILLTKIKDIL